MSESSAIQRDTAMRSLGAAIPPAVVVYVVLAEIGKLPGFGFAFNAVLALVGSVAAVALFELAGDYDE